MPETGGEKLAGQVALVTGASAGIGRATALALARQGADVALNYLTYPEAAEELAGQVRALGRKALLLPGDVADQGAVEQLVERTAAELGGLTILVSNAAYSDREFFYKANMAGFRRTIDVTMWGAFYALRAAANVMIRQGRGGNVVIVSSPHAHIATPSCMAYNMAKHLLSLWTIVGLLRPLLPEAAARCGGTLRGGPPGSACSGRGGVALRGACTPRPGRR